MGFNRRKMEADRKAKVDAEAGSRRAADAQVLEDAEHLIATWNERQHKYMPILLSPTIGAALASQHWWLWVRCPTCKTVNSNDLRLLHRHPNAAVTSLTVAPSCRSCRSNAPFAELVLLSKTGIADEMREEQRRKALGE